MAPTFFIRLRTAGKAGPAGVTFGLNLGVFGTLGVNARAPVTTGSASAGTADAEIRVALLAAVGGTAWGALYQICARRWSAAVLAPASLLSSEHVRRGPRPRPADDAQRERCPGSGPLQFVINLIGPRPRHRRRSPCGTTTSRRTGRGRPGLVLVGITADAIAIVISGADSSPFFF